jgi:ElaB/YqjD/DUF883 family membrane-anchored ribosome-binding protein
MTTTTVKSKIEEKGVDSAVSEAYDHLKDAGKSFKVAATSAKDGASELASENYQRGVESAKKASGYAEGMIKEKPVQSVLLAFGAGWLISKLLK